MNSEGCIYTCMHVHIYRSTFVYVCTCVYVTIEKKFPIRERREKKERNWTREKEGWE